MAKISVVIPVYNAEQYLDECLDSVLSQTFSDIEVICIDDGSTDKSLAILREYAKKDKRVKIITQKNSGVVVARNKAIAAASSEYIYPLDCDDIIAPNTLEKLYNAMIAGRGDIITCRVMYFDRENEEFYLPRPNKYNMTQTNCLVNAALFRKSDFDACGGFDPAFNTALEDYDFWLNMVFRQNKKIYRVPEILFYYRLKPKTDARNYQHRTEHDELLKQLFAKYPETRKYIILSKILKPFKKLGRCILRIEHNELFLFKIIPICKIKPEPKINRLTHDLISVIVPVYKSENTIKRCIDSIIAQTYKNLELIIVYKQGTDKSLDIIQSIKDSRVKIIEQKENTGPGGARNIGINAANGKWLGFIEADDYIAPDFYEKLINAAISNNCDIAQGQIVYGNLVSVNESGVQTRYYNKLSTLKNGASFDKLFRTYLIKENNIKFAECIRFEDNPFIFKALYYGNMVTDIDAKYFYEPAPWSKEYRKQLQQNVLPITKEIWKFLNDVHLNLFERNMAKKAIIKCVAASFLDNEQIYHDLMKLLGNPLFLWRMHRKQKRTKND